MYCIVTAKVEVILYENCFFLMVRHYKNEQLLVLLLTNNEQYSFVQHLTNECL